MIQYPKDTATQFVLTDILSVAKTAFTDVCNMYHNNPLLFSSHYTGSQAWIYGSKEDFKQMLTALFQYIISRNSNLSEMIFAVATNESTVQISICDDGNAVADHVSGMIADSIATRQWITAGLRRAFEIIYHYQGTIRLVRSGTPYNQLLIEFPIVHATKD
ncbi:hypothetical protein ACTHGU_15150 [Chitinophagaceae bacterium MMS25-I14]